MPKSALNALAAILVFALAIGFAVGKLRGRPPAGGPASARGKVATVLRGQALQTSDGVFSLGISGEGAPGIWMQKEGRGAIQMGVHANGFPFLLVSDNAIRNFGLGRVDGALASPIWVLRSDDIVKLVFGLDMAEPGREPFLVYWNADGRKRLLMGNYCDNASRVCVN